LLVVFPSLENIMAATKKDATGEKEKKLTPDESAKLIIDYLRRTNRPYSASDISQNLQNKVTKAAAVKLLKDLHERKEIEGKAQGKQTVYHAVQASNMSAAHDVTRPLTQLPNRKKCPRIFSRSSPKSTSRLLVSGTRRWLSGRRRKTSDIHFAGAL
jgi:hypothetical protein